VIQYFYYFLIVLQTAPEPRKIMFEKKPALSLTLGLPANAKVTPLVRVLDDSENPSVNVTVNLEIEDVVTNKDPSVPNCDKSTRQERAGTLEYMRLSKVCEVVINNGTLKTDELGQASFSKLIFKRHFEY